MAISQLQDISKFVSVYLSLYNEEADIPNVKDINFEDKNNTINISSINLQNLLTNMSQYILEEINENNSCKTHSILYKLSIENILISKQCDADKFLKITSDYFDEKKTLYKIKSFIEKYNLEENNFKTFQDFIENTKKIPKNKIIEFVNDKDIQLLTFFNIFKKNNYFFENTNIEIPIRLMSLKENIHKICNIHEKNNQDTIIFYFVKFLNNNEKNKLIKNYNKNKFNLSIYSDLFDIFQALIYLEKIDDITSFLLKDHYIDDVLYDEIIEKILHNKLQQDPKFLAFSESLIDRINNLFIENGSCLKMSRESNIINYIQNFIFVNFVNSAILTITFYFIISIFSSIYISFIPIYFCSIILSIAYTSYFIFNSKNDDLFSIMTSIQYEDLLSDSNIHKYIGKQNIMRLINENMFYAFKNKNCNHQLLHNIKDNINTFSNAFILDNKIDDNLNHIIDKIYFVPSIFLNYAIKDYSIYKECFSLMFIYKPFRYFFKNQNVKYLQTPTSTPIKLNYKQVNAIKEIYNFLSIDYYFGNKYFENTKETFFLELKLTLFLFDLLNIDKLLNNNVSDFKDSYIKYKIQGLKDDNEQIQNIFSHFRKKIEKGEIDNNQLMDDLFYQIKNKHEIITIDSNFESNFYKLLSVSSNDSMQTEFHSC